MGRKTEAMHKSMLEVSKKSSEKGKKYNILDSFSEFFFKSLSGKSFSDTDFTFFRENKVTENKT